MNDPPKMVHRSTIDKEKNEDRESFEKWMKELEAKEKKEETA